MDINHLTSWVIGAAIEVHRYIGPGLLESAYEACLSKELDLRGLSYARQKEVPLHYKGNSLDWGYRIDLCVEYELVLELKACQQLEPVHKAQVLTYLKLTGTRVGLLLNFNVERMREGIVRVVN